MAEFSLLDLLEFWIVERDAVRHRRASGAPAPWSDDEIFQQSRFCQIERELDRTTVWLRENWREPHADDPDIWFAMCVFRWGGNEPDTFSKITFPLPWDRDRFLEEMNSQGLKSGRRGYRPLISKIKDMPTHEYLARHVFDDLWNRRDYFRPKPGETCRSFTARLCEIKGINVFLAGQVTADVKFTPLLRDAPDAWDFAVPGPGSRPGLQIVCGQDPKKEWASDEAWLETFRRLRSEITPRLEAKGIRLSASDLQSALCELEKYHTAKVTGRHKNRFRPHDGSEPAPKPREAPPAAPSKPAQPPAPAPSPARFTSIFKQIARRYVISPAGNSSGLRLAFDLESDGLLDKATRIHCIVTADVDSGQISEYGPDQIEKALEHLARASYLIGHNIQGFDLPLLQRLHGWGPPETCRIVDTLIASRLILPHIADVDDQAAAISKFPLGIMRGRYSLEAWGLRLNTPKVGAEIGNWAEWTPAIQERCVGDVKLTMILWRFLLPVGQDPRALELEHRIAAICDRITADGMPFDLAGAKQLRRRWEAMQQARGEKLHEQFPKVKNFNSRVQIAGLLEARGWKPERRTERTGQPAIDDELLETLPSLYPEFEGLAEHYIVGRRLGQLANGKQALLNCIGADGRIHGGMVHIGTPHSRAKHMQPNLAQVPNPKKGSPFAAEFRELFRHPDFVCVTADQSNLQDRCFANYLAEHDGGGYARTFAEGDQHWRTAIDLELVPADTERDKENRVHTAIREGAKRFRYAFLFGAGAARLGHIIGDTVRAVQAIDTGSDLQKRIFGRADHPSEAILSRVGRSALERFLQANPGLAQLRRILQSHYRQHDWLRGLDGRRVPGGANWKTLNRLVTSAEAVVCKRWLVRVYDELHERFAYGWAGDAVIAGWIHDEIIVYCRPAIADQVGEILVRHAIEAGEYYDLRLPLDAEFKVGQDWAGTSLDRASSPPPPENDAPADDELNESDQNSPMISTEEVISLVEPPAVAPPIVINMAPPDRAPDPEAPPRTNNRGGHAGNGAHGGKVRCPFHEGDATPSLQIYDEDEDDPHYHCFGCGAHGPLSDLSEELLATASSTACRSANRTETRAYAHRLWAEAKPIAGTLAETYLGMVRGVDVTAMAPDIERSLRFHPRCPFDGKRLPCLLALFRDIETDAPAGIHRIGLTPEVTKIARHMLGTWAEPRAVKLWPAGPRLYLGEGIETVLAAATWLHHGAGMLQPAWAAGSRGNMAKFPVIDGVEELVLLIDRDASGVDAAAACAATWKAAGRRVIGLRTHDVHLNDLNDLVLAKLRASL